MAAHTTREFGLLLGARIAEALASGQPLDITGIEPVDAEQGVLLSSAFSHIAAKRSQRLTLLDVSTLPLDVQRAIAETITQVAALPAEPVLYLSAGADTVSVPFTPSPDLTPSEAESMYGYGSPEHRIAQVIAHE